MSGCAASGALLWYEAGGRHSTILGDARLQHYSGSQSRNQMVSQWVRELAHCMEMISFILSVFYFQKINSFRLESLLPTFLEEGLQAAYFTGPAS